MALTLVLWQLLEHTEVSSSKGTRNFAACWWALENLVLQPSAPCLFLTDVSGQQHDKGLATFKESPDNVAFADKLFGPLHTDTTLGGCSHCQRPRPRHQFIVCHPPIWNHDQSCRVPVPAKHGRERCLPGEPSAWPDTQEDANSIA